ncbi:MAG TPA: OmcA/MtrC family decaheme c-type cytochrome [Thermoanaerobaculia bacterium]|nr:OmcA/MtrC family decaheme c-type cytochrome [Thermoanaerobaculia bacterium]
MSHPLFRVLVLMAIGALSISAYADSTRRRAAAPGTPQPPAATRPSFQQDQLEYYLSDDGIAYIRPGAKITFVSITNVAPGQKPIVELKITDNLDQPLDRLGKVTPGPFSPSMVLAKWDPASRNYITITTRVANGVIFPSTDYNGTWTDLELGRHKYTFNTVMPADLDMTATYTLLLYGRRVLTDVIGKDYYADNVFKEFRPDGGTPAPVWAAMDTATTCNNCHNVLAMHGGTRRTAKSCSLCHNSQMRADPATGASLNSKVLYHKIHRGPNLPSVKGGKPYVVAGRDYSHTTYPQDLRNCTTCHEAKSREAEIWYTRPSRAACGSCHDDINFETGENHGHVGQQIPGQKDDSQCARCHIPDSGQEFDASIKGAHVIPEKSKQLKGLSSTIVSVTDMVAGKKPTVVFSLKNADGTAVDGSKLNTFAPILAGRSTSYSKYFRENAVGKATFDATTGNTTYTFTNAIPEDATGSWTLSADIYRNVVLKRQDGQPDLTIREAAFNPIRTVALSGTMESRRQVVTMDQCNKCHDRLAMHGGQRLMIQECVICHNPTMDDQSQRVAAEGKPESISFQYMIHRIHTGEALKNDFTVFGFGKSKHTYNEVLFPGDRRDCAKCHVNNSHREGKGDAVKTERALFSPMGPTTAACLGCHDSNDAQAHAYLNTAMFGTKSQEACGACHDPGSEWSADKVHAR